MRAIIFRKIAIAAGVTFTIVAIAVALPTAATGQYYGSRYWHGGFGWGFGPGVPFRFGAPYYYGYGAYSSYRYYDYSYGGPYEFGENSTNQDDSADCLWRRRWANDFQGRRVWRRTSGCY